MYWYDFGRNDVYAGNGGNFRRSDCITISQAEKQKIADFFSTRLLKIYFEDQRSYDNSDDERVEDSYSYSNSYVYREVNVERDLYGLVMHGGEIKGVVFYVKNNSRDVYAKVFNFDGKPKTFMRLGYSASHSSSYKTVVRVMLVNKGENGAPESAKEASFIQHELYPEI